mmetsp:Transcript_32336/g.29159  ORF Transcript_32336/g.29159 Transcript_32336/m.29159 type:complete len:106 (-) Transcript_32336:18-335(-)
MDQTNNSQQTHGELFGDQRKHHIPGYKGYIPHVRAENMFGKTYGTLTNLSMSGHKNLENTLVKQQLLRGANQMWDGAGSTKMYILGRGDPGFDPDVIDEDKKAPI